MMGEFFRHGRETGGGSPLFPPPDDHQDDDNAEDDDGNNYVPVPLPPHLQVMVPPTEPNLDILQGPNQSLPIGHIIIISFLWIPAFFYIYLHISY